jgi:hypothetical protein
MADEHDDEPTCGKGVAGNAVLPEKVAVAMRATADVLENHIRALDAGEANGKAEEDAYRRLISLQRSVAAQLDALAAMMRGYRGLHLASHDMDVIGDARSVEVFGVLVEREQDLLALLQARVAEYKGMLDAMRSG